MAVNYTIIIRGSGPTDVQPDVEAFVKSLRAAGHEIANADLEKRELADVSPAAIDAKAAITEAQITAVPAVI